MSFTRFPTDKQLTPEELKPWVRQMHAQARNICLADASAEDGFVYFLAQDRDQVIDAEPKYVRIPMQYLMQTVAQCAVIGAMAKKMIGPPPVGLDS